MEMYIFKVLTTSVVLEFLETSGCLTLMLLYLGPETIMPLTSILAAIIGFLLIFWRILIKPFKKIAKSADQQQDEVSPSDPASPLDLPPDLPTG